MAHRAKVTDQERDEARDTLRKLLPPGSTVYTVIRHVSASGMSRCIDLYVIQDNRPRWLSGYACKAAGFTWDDKRESIRVGGCGMDMAWHLVYELASAIYSEGYGCIGIGCPANDHTNGDRNRDHWHRDGGYALRKEAI